VIKQAYVAQVKGHKNNRGELAEFVIKKHETGEILSSHKTREEAEKHLQQMHEHKNKESAVAPENFKWFKNIDALLDRNCVDS